MQDVSVIVPYYHSPEDLAEFLERLTSFDGEIIIVSNDETGSTPPVISHPTAKLIELHQNTGFSHACNVGAAHASSDYLFFVNPDTALTTEVLYEMLDQMKQQKLDAASPLLTNDKAEVSQSYHQNYLSLVRVLLYYVPVVGRVFFSVLPAKPALTGAALCVRSKSFWKLGGWNELLWLWWEDVDLNLRLDRAGFRWSVLRSVSVRHEGGATFTQPEKWRLQTYFHSLRLFMLANFGKVAERLCYLLTSRFSTSESYPQDTTLESFDLHVVATESKLRKSLATIKTSASMEIIVLTPFFVSSETRKKHPLVIFCQYPEGFSKKEALEYGRKRSRAPIFN